VKSSPTATANTDLTLTKHFSSLKEFHGFAKKNAGPALGPAREIPSLYKTFFLKAEPGVPERISGSFFCGANFWERRRRLAEIF
jgi:hypothetical protein